MSRELSVTFRDRLNFEARSGHQMNPHHLPYHHHHHHPHHRGDHRARTHLAKAGKGHNFIPRYHTVGPGTASNDDMCFSLRQDGNKYKFFSDRNIKKNQARHPPPPGSSSGEGAHSRHHRSLYAHNYCGNTSDDSMYTRALGAAIALVGNREVRREQKGMGSVPFKTRFRPSQLDEGRVQSARERMECGCSLYKDPLPFNYRVLDRGSTQLSTTLPLLPPSHGDLREEWRPEYSYNHDNSSCHGSRSSSKGMQTHMTPEPLFYPSLLLKKDVYTPAFSAYYHFLDRINHSIQSKI